MVFSSPSSGFICLPTGQTPDLLLPLWSETLWCVVLFLSLSDSSLFYFCHSFIIQPTLIPYCPTLISEHPTQFSVIVSQLIHSILISPYVYYWVMVCAQRPALNMYVYNVWCLPLAFPRLDINLDSSTACLLYSNLRVVLVDTLFTQSWSPVPVCVQGT